MAFLGPFPSISTSILLLFLFLFLNHLFFYLVTTNVPIYLSLKQSVYWLPKHIFKGKTGCSAIDRQAFQQNNTVENGCNISTEKISMIREFLSQVTYYSFRSLFSYNSNWFKQNGYWVFWAPRIFGFRVSGFYWILVFQFTLLNSPIFPSYRTPFRVFGSGFGFS